MTMRAGTRDDRDAVNQPSSFRGACKGGEPGLHKPASAAAYGFRVRSLTFASRNDEDDCNADGRGSAQPDLLEGLADPGTLVLGRLAAARFHQRVGVLVPLAVGEVMAEHGSGGLRLVDDAERHIGLGQALQRLLDM